LNAFEVNFDGLIGPTHNYSGLSAGNIASQSHRLMVSHPKAAALQGIQKMRTLVQLGYQQGFLPPQLRPDFTLLRQLGFTGDQSSLLKQVVEQDPELLSLVYSASSMWAANAATVTPSADSGDGKLHFTPANLVTTLHRAIECSQTYQTLRQVFADADKFTVHPPLTAHPQFGDEGAANHNRLTSAYGATGIGVFVYGNGEPAPQVYPARQTLAASRAVARQHGVAEQSLFLKQNPDAIDAGAFHNDVVAVANGPVLFFHEQAFNRESEVAALARLEAAVPGFTPIRVPADQVSLADAIGSYLFNSQLLAAPNGDMAEMTLVAPMECAENPAVRDYLEALSRDQQQPIRDVVFVDVRQSMANGGGPACLRLRVVLTEAELAAVDQRFMANNHTLDQLEAWVEDFYRDDLAPEDLSDPAFMDEAYRALKALEVVLGIEGFYAF
jgi:succinylarginine dihydrolase